LIKRRIAMGRKRKNKKHEPKETSAVSPACKYEISGKFVWQGISYNVGEPIPNFLPVAFKEDLWKQHKLRKIDEQGNPVLFRIPKTLTDGDIYNIMFNPSSLNEWFERFEVDVTSLNMVLAQCRARNVGTEYIELIEKEIEKNGKKEEGAVAERCSEIADGAVEGGERTGDEVSQG